MPTSCENRPGQAKRTSFTRRTMLKAGVGAAGLIGLGPLSALGEDLRLRMYWWGSKERADRTEKVNALYRQKNPGVTLDGETLGWGDYWPRMATQTAGRNAADILQMDYRYIFEYARRGALLPLDSYVPGTLNLGDFSKEAVDSGRVDGKIYGVSLGLNSTAMMYDKALLESLGLAEPPWNASWSEIADYATAITKAAKRDGFAGIQDAGRYEPALEVFLRQQGKALYTADGKLGFGESEAAAWLGFWNDLRKRGGCVSPEIQALDREEIESNMLTQGKAALAFAHSNQLVGFQALNKSKLGMRMYPGGGSGAKPGQYLKPSMLFSVSARAKQPEAAVKVVDFYVRDVEAGKLLGVERGVPASAAVRTAIEPTLDALGQEMARYVSFVTDKVGPLPPPPPSGAGEIQNVLRKVNEQIGFGRLTVADGAKQLIAEAQAILARG
jgi:multiple sugar transport system substrate-binding protein